MTASPKLHVQRVAARANADLRCGRSSDQGYAEKPTFSSVETYVFGTGFSLFCALPVVRIFGTKGGLN